MVPGPAVNESSPQTQSAVPLIMKYASGQAWSVGRVVGARGYFQQAGVGVFRFQVGAWGSGAISL